MGGCRTNAVGYGACRGDLILSSSGHVAILVARSGPLREIQIAQMTWRYFRIAWVTKPRRGISGVGRWHDSGYRVWRPEDPDADRQIRSLVTVGSCAYTTRQASLP